MSTCGTYAGWNAHRRHGTPVCDDCRRAATVYARQRRRRDGLIPEPERAVRKALRRAIHELTVLGADQALIAELRADATEGVYR